MLLSSESVHCLSGQWLSSEEWTGVREKRQHVQSHLRMEKDGAGTSQARDGTEAWSDEKGGSGGYKGKGRQETGVVLLGEGVLRAPACVYVCGGGGGTHVYMGTSD